MENIKSTKFIYAVLVTVLGFVLVILGKVESPVYLNFVEIVGATYVLGNVVSKFAPKE